MGGSNSSENRKKNHNVSSSNNNPVVSTVSLYSLDTLLSVKRISMNLNKEINKQMESFFGILDERIEAIAKGKRICKEEEAKPIQDNSKISKKEQLKGKDKRKKRKRKKE